MMLQRTVSENSITFGVVLAVGESTLSVRLDTSSVISDVRIYGDTKPSAGDRVLLVWGSREGAWIAVGRPSASPASSSSTIFDISGFPAAPQGNRYLAIVNGALTWADTPGGVPSFLALTDTPNGWGSPGQYLVVNESGNGLTYASLSVDTSSYLVRADIKVGYGLLKSLDTVGNGLTLAIGVHDHANSSQGGQIAHASLTGLNTGDPHNMYASADTKGTRSAYMAERLNKSVVTGFGLQGGGSLGGNSDITIQAKPADFTDNLRGLNLLSDKIGVNLSAASGMEFSSGKLQLSDSIAGAGLTIASKILAVGNGNGISVAADTVSVDEAASFAWTGSHTFGSTLRVHTNILFDAGRSLQTQSGYIRLWPQGSLYLSPADDNVILDGDVSIRSDTFASQTSGWRMTNSGELDARYIYADEMHVKTFIADLEMALAGGQIIAKSVTMLAQDFVVPAPGASATLYVKDLPSATGIAVFEAGDIVGMRAYARSGLSLTVFRCFGVVTAYTDQGNGVQTWTFTRSDTPYAGTVDTGTTILKETIVIDYGVSGNGYHEVNANDGLAGSNSPYSQVVTWATHPINSTVRTRMGNLRGITGNSEHGFWAGQNTTTRFLRLSDTHFESHGLAISLYHDGTERIRMDPNTPSLAIGSIVPSAFGEQGIWMGRHTDNTYRFSMSDTGDHYLHWTYDSVNSRYVLTLSGDIHVRNSQSVMGGTNLGGSILVDSYGRILMGSNSFFSMGVGSTFGAGAGSSFSIGVEGTGAYLSYANGVLKLEGQIFVTDGSDIEKPAYRIRHSNINKPSATYDATTMTVVLTGTIHMVSGRSCLLLTPPSQSIDRSGSTLWTAYVYKNGGGVYVPNLGRDPYGLDDTLSWAYWEGQLYSQVEYFLMRTEAFEIEGDPNKVAIAYLRINSTFTEVSSLASVGLSGTTTISHDFITTPNLSALSANLGTITAGSISGITMTLTNGANTLWLNHGTQDIVLAVGSTTVGIADAPFKIWEDGRFAAGNPSNYISWDGTKLWIKGQVDATEGSLASLNVSGNLTMGVSGRIQWNSNNSYIDSSKIVISDARSTVRIGDISQLSLGVINIDMVDSGQGSWRHGVRVADAGNALANVTSLYYGESNIPNVNAVDRIFYAFTGNGSYADGFYAENASSSAWNNFDTAGASFKGKHNAGGPVALFNQQGGGADAPVVWATSQNTNRSIFIAEVGAHGQQAFRVLRNSYDNVVGFNASSTGIEEVRYQRFMNLATNTPGAGDAGVPAASGPQEFIVYARQGALRMKNSQYEWIIASSGQPVSL